MAKIQIAGAGFIKVDAVYGKQYAELDGPDWPKTYQSPVYPNIFSAGIASAPQGDLQFQINLL